MPPRRSASLPLELMRGEIEEIAQRLAELLKTPSGPVDRARKTEIRALLRTAFAALQDDSSLADCQRLLGELRKSKALLSGEPIATPAPDEKLMQRTQKRDKFGAVERPIGRTSDRFVKHVNKAVDGLSAGITDRVEKTLTTLTDNPQGPGPTHGVKTRPIKSPNEERQLITTKVS